MKLKTLFKVFMLGSRNDEEESYGGDSLKKNKCYNFVSEPLKSNIANAKGRKRSLRMSIDDTFRLLRQGQSE